MKNIKKIIVIAVISLLAIVSLVKTINERKKPVDCFYTIGVTGTDKTLVSWYEEKDITVALVDNEGKIEKSVKIPLKKGKFTHEIEAACMGENEKVYLILNSRLSVSGEVEKKELYVYDFSKIFIPKTVISTEQLQDEADKDQREAENIWTYKWMNTTGNALSLIGVNSDCTKAVRKVFEFGAITNNNLNVKSERVYPLAEGEGIYQAIGNGTDLAYISKAGKLFHATETQVQEVYPAREVDVLMYPLYLSYAETGYVYMQDGQSGDIIKLNLMDGTEEVLLKGTAAFSAADVVTPQDICMMSMTNMNHFSAVIKNNQGNGYRLFTVRDGIGVVTDSVIKPYGQLVVLFMKTFLLSLGIVGLVVLVIYGIVVGILKGRTIIGKLILAALPILILSMFVFGIIAYRYYWDSVITSYEKQTIDEGNMMTALFGQESFDAIEYPYDYNSDNYMYLEQQMEGRELYSRVVYYEDGESFMGVDPNSPCFYPIGMLMNSELDMIYKEAAMLGETVTANIQDRTGKRIVSVTPVGGTAGRSVYLYETGVYEAVLDAYQEMYVKNFLWICMAFVVVVSILLIAMFLHILQPLSEVKEGMEKFTGGNRNIRIEPETNDELAGICQAFNKMADDIDIQIKNLQKLSDTYYKFMPLSIIGLLGTDNLDQLMLGSQIQGTYAVLSIQIRHKENNSLHIRENEINRFFNVINIQAMEYNAIPIVDSANLTSMLLLCKDGVASAIRLALMILASIDAYNASETEENQFEIMCLLHRSEIFVGICGDEERYIPVLITPELENMLKKKDIYTKVGARLLVTGQTYAELDLGSSFESRYIGNLGIEEDKGGFYEFYDDRGAEEVHLLKVTESNFRKAMKLFEQGYLYEAKNLFTMVLQEHPDDKIAKYYIFRCE